MGKLGTQLLHIKIVNFYFLYYTSDTMKNLHIYEYERFLNSANRHAQVPSCIVVQMTIQYEKVYHQKYQPLSRMS